MGVKRGYLFPDMTAEWVNEGDAQSLLFFFHLAGFTVIAHNTIQHVLGKEEEIYTGSVISLTDSVLCVTGQLQWPFGGPCLH